MARETVDAILAAQEGERSRIARELHDETGSALTAVLLGLAAIEEAATLPEARHASAALRETARSALESVGRLAFALRPAVLDEFGLVPALKGLGGGLEELGGPKVAFEIDLPAGVRLPAELETSLFRITQEALTNVVKHAEATTAHVILTCPKRTLLLAVEDDGRGFLPSTREAGRVRIGRCPRASRFPQRGARHPIEERRRNAAHDRGSARLTDRTPDRPATPRL